MTGMASEKSVDERQPSDLKNRDLIAYSLLVLEAYLPGCQPVPLAKEWKVCEVSSEFFSPMIKLYLVYAISAYAHQVSLKPRPHRKSFKFHVPL
jgi:hypothetical protein